MKISRAKVVIWAVVGASIATWMFTRWLLIKNDSLFQAGQIEKDDWVLQQSTQELLGFIAAGTFVIALIWTIADRLRQKNLETSDNKHHQ